MLVAKVAGDSDITDGRNFCVPVDFTAGHNLRQNVRRFQVAQNALVPLQRGKIHQLGTAGVGNVSDVYAAGQLPNQKAVDRTADQITGFGLCARTGYIFKDPANF